jgi:hypothetical protein
VILETRSVYIDFDVPHGVNAGLIYVPKKLWWKSLGRLKVSYTWAKYWIWPWPSMKELNICATDRRIFRAVLCYISEEIIANIPLLGMMYIDEVRSRDYLLQLPVWQHPLGADVALPTEGIAQTRYETQLLYVLISKIMLDFANIVGKLYV